MKRRQRIVVGLSGGVDSAVAAWLLKREGHEVVGVFMKNWEDDDTDEYCTSRQDLIDAAAVADVIGIEIEAVNFAREYRERVFVHFLNDYRAGRTPNPDVLCNSEIKFNAFLDHALSLGAERIATGHYAQLERADDGVRLLKAADGAKDQTYFLHRLDQRQLDRTLFPVGHLTKSAVRAIAREQRIPTYAKKDSTGICFIGERPFRDFLARYLPRRRVRSRPQRAASSADIRGWCITRSASVRAWVLAAGAARMSPHGLSPPKISRATCLPSCRAVTIHASMRKR